MLYVMCLLLGFILPGQQAVAAVLKHGPKTAKSFSQVVPLSTKSAEARAALQRGVVKWENHRMAQAVDDFRKATQADPDFAVAHLFLSTLTSNPEEQSSELKKAVALRDSTSMTEAERLLISWLSNTSQNQILPAIASMNELLGRYPKDKHLLYRAAIWFRNQRQSARALPLYERLLQLDPEFADALNQLGYTYAFEDEFDKAIATMKRYVAVLPNEPNPEDSYAEIFRMAGRYDEALAHYRRALQIEPSYWSSQEGIAGTYMLMGDYARARAEYTLAIEHAPSQATALSWTANSAVIWVREKDYAKANAVLAGVAGRAHDNNLAALESTAYRMMALFEKDPAARQELLDRSEAALGHNHALSKLTSEQQTALILRARTYAYLDAGNIEAASRVLEQLRSAQEKTHNGFIQVVYHGAAGAVLTMQGKYEDAIGELLEDDGNPFSIRFLVLAYQKNGSGEDAARWAARLASLRSPTLEQALVQ
ncbi:MAG TPA: tetratricopeptide repeat protein [Candidatus Saccharimonadales bacterium]|jgi:tetratricopeptide (TPR) repeat protein|nr:tetratricopeptide repeat protein [Candidatus Saccharimonadales bacterium]